jgi:hypothetical protein
LAAFSVAIAVDALTQSRGFPWSFILLETPVFIISRYH